MNRKWPVEIDAAVRDAIIDSMPVKEMFAQLRTGELPGIDRGYPDYPYRTFQATVARVRKRMRESLKVRKPGEPRPSFLAQLPAREEAFLAEQRVKERESAPESIPQPPESPAEPVRVARPLDGPDREREREALLARLEGLIEQEPDEPTKPMTGTERRAATRAKMRERFGDFEVGKRVQPHHDKYGFDPS